MGNVKRRVEGAIEEVAGKIKKGVGKAIGSEPLEHRGRADEIEGRERQENAKALERAKGALQQAAGRVERRVGRAIGNPRIEGEGAGREVEGRARKRASEADTAPFNKE